MEQSPKHILLVEDDQFLLNLIGPKIEREGFALTIAKNGQDGLAEVQRSMPDLILLDIVLPDLNGFEILEKIKANEALSSIPVVILSNLGQPENIKKGKELGAIDYLVKVQHTPQDIVDKVKNLLGV